MAETNTADLVTELSPVAKAAVEQKFQQLDQQMAAVVGDLSALLLPLRGVLVGEAFGKIIRLMECCYEPGGPSAFEIAARKNRRLV